MLGSISGAGVLLKTLWNKEFQKKNWAVPVCGLSSICDPFYEVNKITRIDYKDYLTCLRVLDDIIIDMCPLVDKWNKKYSQKSSPNNCFNIITN